MPRNEKRPKSLYRRVLGAAQDGSRHSVAGCGIFFQNARSEAPGRPCLPVEINRFDLPNALMTAGVRGKGVGALRA